MALTKKQRELIQKPLLDEIKALLDQHVCQVPPKSKLGTALDYLREYWPGLVVFICDGNLSISNNHAERLIRPFVIGRKNWLFSSSVAGAEASAALYSLAITAKENGLDALQYLQVLFTELPILYKQRSTPENQQKLDEYLPWNWKPPVAQDSE